MLDKMLVGLSMVKLLLLSLFLRLGLIIYGCFQDRFLNVKYTDIDYKVFSDASLNVLNGISPFNRRTYRYTPILAWLLVPNHVLFNSFGKVIFSCVDVVTGWILQKIFQIQHIPQQHQIISCSFWLLNPLTAVVSSRGNAESLMAFLMVLSLYLIMKNRVVLGAMTYALAVHMKIYPVIYCLPILLNIGPNPFDSRTKGLSLLHHVVTKNRIQFIVTGAMVYSCLTLFCYLLYGWDFVYEAILYHIQRTDIRHNFSVYFYSLYLTQANGFASIINIGMIAFLPQVILTIIVAFKYYKHLPICFFMQTFLFVTFNKICTSQYFLWYLTFLPLIVPGLISTITMKEALILLVVWFGAQGIWLGSAYLLEYHGLNTFLFVWIAGGIFFAVNIWIIKRIHNAYKPRHMKTS